MKKDAATGKNEGASGRERQINEVSQRRRTGKWECVRKKGAEPTRDCSCQHTFISPSLLPTFSYSNMQKRTGECACSASFSQAFLWEESHSPALPEHEYVGFSPCVLSFLEKRVELIWKWERREWWKRKEKAHEKTIIWRVCSWQKWVLLGFHIWVASVSKRQAILPGRKTLDAKIGLPARRCGIDTREEDANVSEKGNDWRLWDLNARMFFLMLLLTFRVRQRKLIWRGVGFEGRESNVVV